MSKQKESVCISGLMLRNAKDRMIVEVEIDGRWVKVIDEFIGPMETAVSHIVEPLGIRAAAGKYHVEAKAE